jgi:phosphate transport system protein
MTEHIIKAFDEELSKLRFRLVKMGSLVQEQIEFAIKSFMTNNLELAKIVIDREEKVDKLDIKIDKQCLRIFALQQPLANDLRLVMSALSINEDMELIGDLAVYIARNVIDMNASAENLIDETKILEMTKFVDDMIIKVMDSFVYNDVELARTVISSGSQVDKLWKQNFELINTLIEKNPSNSRLCTYMIDIIRNLQFISDQAISISREVIFLVEAKIVEHINNFEIDEIPGER